MIVKREDGHEEEKKERRKPRLNTYKYIYSLDLPCL